MKDGSVRVRQSAAAFRDGPTAFAAGVERPAPGSGTEARLLSGVDALVRLLVLRQQLDERDGLTTATMVSGYPGSPLGHLRPGCRARTATSLAAHRIVHRPGLNEELAAATVWGSQMGAVIDYAAVDGVAGVWYGKAPGLDRSGDVLKHGNSMGSGPNGGVVLFCGDDPTAKSSTLACDSQYTFEDACIPVLYPGDQQDVLDLGIHAFRLSRYAGCWVGLKIVTAVADGIGTADVEPRPAPPEPIRTDLRHRRPALAPPAPGDRRGPRGAQPGAARGRPPAARPPGPTPATTGSTGVVGAGPAPGSASCAPARPISTCVQAFADLGVGLERPRRARGRDCSSWR